MVYIPKCYVSTIVQQQSKEPLPSNKGRGPSRILLQSIQRHQQRYDKIAYLANVNRWVQAYSSIEQNVGSRELYLTSDNIQLYLLNRCRIRVVRHRLTQWTRGWEHVSLIVSAELRARIVENKTKVPTKRVRNVRYCESEM